MKMEQLFNLFAIGRYLSKMKLQPLEQATNSTTTVAGGRFAGKL